jgi:hypothetical protein
MSSGVIEFSLNCINIIQLLIGSRERIRTFVSISAPSAFQAGAIDQLCHPTIITEIVKDDFRYYIYNMVDKLKLAVERGIEPQQL